jgi:hypothetical protein
LPVSRVPVFLCIDLEPVEREVHDSSTDSWRGVDAIVEWLGALRPRLADTSGEDVRLLWFLRCDPQVEVAFGAPNALMLRSASTLDALREGGDAIGLHTHPWRWEEDEASWIADYDNPAWIEHCVETSFEAYRSHFGRPCELHRFGDHWMSAAVVPVLEEKGVRFDFSVEPGARGMDSLAPGERTSGSIPDYTRAPREPYRPSSADARVPNPTARSGLWIIPLSAANPGSALPLSWRIGRRVRFPFRPLHRPLYMFREWTSPEAFWDMVQRYVDSSERPYLAFAIRSGDPESPDEQRVRSILEHLPEHPLGSRVVFTNPEAGLRLMGLEAAEALPED